MPDHGPAREMTPPEHIHDNLRIFTNNLQGMAQALRESNLFLIGKSTPDNYELPVMPPPQNFFMDTAELLAQVRSQIDSLAVQIEAQRSFLGVVSSETRPANSSRSVPRNPEPRSFADILTPDDLKGAADLKADR